MTDIIAPQQEAVLIEAQEKVSVVVPQREIVAVEAQVQTVLVTPQLEAIIIELQQGLTGPAGPAGPQGVPGEDGTSDLPEGDDGDIIRYNATTGDWESRSEPFEFHGIVLIPMSLPGSPVEGFLGYNAVDNGLYVAVE